MPAATWARALAAPSTWAGRPAQATLPPMVDLWITPPTYTRRAPLASEQTRGQNTLAVPTGSSARLQAHHLAAGSTAELAYGDATTPLKELGPGSAEGSVVLDRDVAGDQRLPRDRRSPAG